MENPEALVNELFAMTLSFANTFYVKLSELTGSPTSHFPVIQPTLLTIPIPEALVKLNDLLAGCVEEWNKGLSSTNEEARLIGYNTAFSKLQEFSILMQNLQYTVNEQKNFEIDNVIGSLFSMLDIK